MNLRFPLRRVGVVTPLGEGGAGGIDRMMDALRLRRAEFAREGFEVDFFVSRGAGPLALAPIHLAATLGQVAASAWGRGPDLLHVNLSSHGSALRKLAVAATARRAGLPYVVHLHGSRFQGYFESSGSRLRGALVHMFESAARKREPDDSK